MATPSTQYSADDPHATHSPVNLKPGGHEVAEINVDMVVMLVVVPFVILEGVMVLIELGVILEEVVVVAVLDVVVLVVLVMAVVVEG